MTAPTSSEEWIDDILDAVVSDVKLSGYFRTVSEGEPKRAPGQGLTAAVWMQRMFGVGVLSGLNTTSGVLVFNVRIYSNMLAEPQDEIDRKMTRAASNVMRRWHDDFDFEMPTLIRNVDLLGITQVQLDCNAGYLEIDRKMFRIYDITLPVIVNDIWTQG